MRYSDAMFDTSPWQKYTEKNRYPSLAYTSKDRKRHRRKISALLCTSRESGSFKKQFFLIELSKTGFAAHPGVIYGSSWASKFAGIDKTEHVQRAIMVSPLTVRHLVWHRFRTTYSFSNLFLRNLIGTDKSFSSYIYAHFFLVTSFSSTACLQKYIFRF